MGTKNELYRNKIKALRHLHHLTQQKMADQMGYNDVKEYGRIETGEKRLDLELLESIAEVFGMSVVELLGFDEKAALGLRDGTANGANWQRMVIESGLDNAHARIEHLNGEVEFLREQLKEALKRGK